MKGKKEVNVSSLWSYNMPPQFQSNFVAWVVAIPVEKYRMKNDVKNKFQLVSTPYGPDQVS